VPDGQLSLFDEPSVAQKDATRDPITVGSGLPRGLPRGFYGKPFDVGFEIPVVPSEGALASYGNQVWRDVETLVIGWPETEEEADFYRRRIRRYLKTIGELQK
jgi:hypothetical protein